MAANLVFGSYVTSATFCLKLGKTEIAALARFNESKKLHDNTDAAFWSLASKGLIERTTDSMLQLTAAMQG